MPNETANQSALKIFYGPPGAGKTYAAVREAVLLIDGELPVENGVVSQDKVAERYRELVASKRVWFVTFHPTYSYEDFIEGFRPDSTSNGGIGYSLRDGPFKQACNICRGSAPRSVQPGDTLTEGRGSWTVESVSTEIVVLRASTVNAKPTRKFVAWTMVDSIVAAIEAGKITLDDLNIPKGVDVAEEHRARVSEVVDVNSHYLADQGPLRALVKQQLRGRLYLGQQLGGYTVTQVFNEGVVVQSNRERRDNVGTGWEQFVPFWLIDRLRDRGLTPDSVSIAGKDYEEKKPLARRAGISVSYVNEMGPVRAVWEALAGQRTRARARTVIIIDEINRADLSRVFGELLTLLEHDKREGMAEETSVYLPYSKALFSVPSELSVIGTMNTTDRSLSVVDYALRRRFEFIEVPPNSSLCPTNYGGINVAKFLDLLNERLEFLRSREHRVGHAELMEHKLEVVRRTHFDGKDDGKIRAFAWLLRHKLIPLLLDYFPEDWRRARAVLGNNSLFKTVAPPGDLVQLDTSIVSVDDVEGFRHPIEFDPQPENDMWNPSKFLTALGENNPDVIIAGREGDRAQ